ncbi:hypothetical protein OJ252_2011 [Cryptosporidium canis]|uniref:Uncharacterized protein n=1 Tax=Cryptosporidium canis TaxID=195482 RepID=A0ABQ8P8S4_9CRYT|nr:hypothetical protein OJ252_2011 [Cryptosporidium canis]
MLDGKGKRQIYSKLHETGVKYSQAKNVVYEDENSNELNRFEFPRNTLLRSKGLPEKLEKHLNNEKERELESLYEENRQLLVEISKLRKTNQLLVKDVNKKNEIIDSLDSSLVEVEEKLESAKKKNWSMYNEILSREKDLQEKSKREQGMNTSNTDEEAYSIRASKIGTFNTVDIVKTKSKKESSDIRPKSTSISTSTDNTKWLQDIILESLSEKHVEKKAYDDLKYEVEKLQKEIYSMQTDLLRSNSNDEVIQEPIVDEVNGKLSVFHSTNSSTNNSSIIGTSVSGFNTINNVVHSTSLAQELNDVNCSIQSSSIGSLQENEESSEGFDQDNQETIPPRSVHILMGKTFSSENNIDRKINKYKNGLRYGNENSNINYSMEHVNGYYNHPPQGPSMTPIHHHYQQPCIPPSTNTGHYYYSLSNTGAIHPYTNYYERLHPRNYPPPYYTGSTNPLPSISAYNSINSKLFNSQDSVCNSEGPFYMGNVINQPPMTNSLIYPSTNISYTDRRHPHYPPHSRTNNIPGPIFNPFPTSNSTAGSIPFPTQTFDQQKNQNMPFPPFKIKITQKFRRNRNNSVPPRPKDIPEQVATSESMSGQAQTGESNTADKDLPQGYIRFKTSIASPLSQDDFFSPVSMNVNQVCPCDKAINSCASISKAPAEQSSTESNKVRSVSNALPLPISLISKNNQFLGTSGLLKFSKY